jgi:hypothetical protein
MRPSNSLIPCTLETSPAQEQATRRPQPWAARAVKRAAAVPETVRLAIALTSLVRARLASRAVTAPGLEEAAAVVGAEDAAVAVVQEEMPDAADARAQLAAAQLAAAGAAAAARAVLVRAAEARVVRAADRSRTRAKPVHSPNRFARCDKAPVSKQPELQPWATGPAR